MDTESRKIVEFLVFFRDSALKAIRPDDWKKQGPIHLHNFHKIVRKKLEGLYAIYVNSRREKRIIILQM